MRHRHFLFSVAITAIALSSCHTTTYYQVYEMKTPELTTKESCLTYDNEDCSIMYNLWAPGGDASFLISNKTGKNLDNGAGNQPMESYRWPMTHLFELTRLPLGM